MSHILKPLKNQKGILTLDLIFGLSLVLGGMIIVLALALTFTAVEVAQYIAFSSSRAYYAAHINEEKQRTRAQEKFDELISKPAIKSIFRRGWFGLEFLGATDYKSEYPISGAHSPLQGTVVKVQAKLLSFNVPFFGRTTEDDKGLSTSVNSFLGREPSTEECMSVNRERWKKIKAFTQPGKFLFTDTGDFVIADNGC